MLVEILQSSLHSLDKIIVMSNLMVRHFKQIIFTIDSLMSTFIVWHYFKFETNDKSMFSKNNPEQNSVYEFTVKY